MVSLAYQNVRFFGHEDVTTQVLHFNYYFLGGRNWKRQNWCKYLTAIYLENTIFPPRLRGSFDLHHSANVSCLSSAGLQYSSDPDCV